MVELKVFLLFPAKQFLNEYSDAFLLGVRAVPNHRCVACAVQSAVGFLRA